MFSQIYDGLINTIPEIKSHLVLNFDNDLKLLILNADAAYIGVFVIESSSRLLSEKTAPYRTSKRKKKQDER